MLSSHSIKFLTSYCIAEAIMSMTSLATFDFRTSVSAICQLKFCLGAHIGHLVLHSWARWEEKVGRLKVLGIAVPNNSNFHKC